MVAIAQTSPFLVTLRCSPLTRPPMVTCEPVRAFVGAGQRCDRAVGGGGEHVLDPEQRVVGDVEPEHLPLVLRAARVLSHSPIGTAASR